MSADHQGLPLPQVMVRWQNTLIKLIGSATPDLTNRQTALLLVVCLEAKPHTGTALAKRLGVAKPVISRALNSLSEFRFIKRIADTDDLRSTFIEATDEGLAFVALLTRLLASTGGDDTGLIAAIRS